METKCGSHYFMVSATYVPSLDVLEQQTTETTLNTQFELVSNAVISVQGNPRLRAVKDAKSWLIECLRVLSQGEMSHFCSVAGEAS